MITVYTLILYVILGHGVAVTNVGIYSSEEECLKFARGLSSGVSGRLNEQGALSIVWADCIPTEWR